MSNEQSGAFNTSRLVAKTIIPPTPTDAESDTKLCTPTLDINVLIQQLLNGHNITEKQIEIIMNQTKQLLISEPNCVKLHPPVSIAGDIHGQYQDMIELFCVEGLPPDIHLLVLGDYVDRGYFSIRVFCLLCCFKIRYPERLTLLRGNHESRQLSEVYGFYDECLRRYNGPAVWRMITDTFDFLPLSAVIGSQIFCAHGGISKNMDSVDAIQSINRFTEPPLEGSMADILWSDPSDEFLNDSNYGVSPRGAGMLFNKMATKQFLHTAGLELITRAHQLVDAGFQWAHDDSVLTVFSAPNYCYRYHNQGGVVSVAEDLSINCYSFDAAPR